MSDINTDIIRSLLNELITTVKETKGDIKNQKQNDLIIDALNDLVEKTSDNKINVEEFAKELSEKISDKLIPVMKQTSNDQIEATKESSEEVHHSSNTDNPGNGNNGSGGNGGGGGNNINPDATEPEKELGNAAKGAAKSLSGMSKVVNIAAKGAELGLIALAGVSTEAKKGLDNTFKAFNQMSDAGVSFNGSASEMRQAAAESGMSLEQFTKSVTSSSNTFRTLSPDQISRFNRVVVDASNSMQGLALTTDQRQEYENDYMNIVSSQGQIQQQTSESVQQGFINLVKTSRDLSTVFGDSASSISKSASEFLKSRDGFTSATMLTQNQNNVQTVAMLSRELFQNLGVRQNLQNSILTAAGTGVMSSDLLKYMSASRGNSEQIRAMIDALSQVMRSNRTVSAEQSGRIANQAINRVANTRTNYDNSSLASRGIMSTYTNQNYEDNIEASQIAARARALNQQNANSRLHQADQSATHPDRTLSNAVLANRIQTQDLPMLHDAVQTEALLRFQHTIADGLNLYHTSLTQSTNFLNNNSKAIGNNTTLLDKMGQAIVGFVNNLPDSHAVIGGTAVGGEVLHDIFSAINGPVGAAGLLATAAFGRHGGGVTGLARQLTRLTRSIPNMVKNMGGARASTTAGEAAEGVASRSGSVISKVIPGVSRLSGGIVAGGLSAIELMNNYNDYKEGKESHSQWKKNNYEEVGQGVGGVAGAALGSLVGPLGTIAGGIAGEYIGQTLGKVGYNIFNSSKSSEVHDKPKTISKTISYIVPHEPKDRNILQPTNENSTKITNGQNISKLSEVHNISKPIPHISITESEKYLKNIDKNVELIKNIINPSDISTNQLVDNTNPNNINNAIIDNNIDNDFTSTKATNKTEADLDSLVKGIGEMLLLMKDINLHMSTNVVETQTQNTMVHDLLNRVNNSVKQISQKPLNSLNN